MRGQHEDGAAVSAASVKTGVTNDENYENLSTSIHGFGKRHNCDGVEREGEAALCGRCGGLSTGGGPIAGRAGDHYDGEGRRPEPTAIKKLREERDKRGNIIEVKEVDGFRNDTLDTNDDRITKPVVDEETLEAIEHDCETCDIGNCRSCNIVNAAILQPSYTVSKGGGSSSKRKRDKPQPISMVDRVRDDAVPESEEQRAERLIREAQERRDRVKPGPPLKGKEPRMHIQGRMEPTTVLELNQLTGKGCIAVLEDVHTLLVMAKSGAEAKAVLDRVVGMLKDTDADDADHAAA